MSPPRQRGAAIVTAMLIAALAAVMVTTMFWQQWAAIAREQTARNQTQARWILLGAIDWARIILRADGQSSTVDYLGEPWSVPLAEARLSTFLAAHGQDTAGLPDAWMEGRIVDAQSRFNLRDIAPSGAINDVALAAFTRLCASLQLPASVATDIADGVAASTRPVSDSGNTDAQPLPLRSLQDLARLGASVTNALPALAPYVTILPQTTPVNANTAPALVLAAVLDVNTDTAHRLVQARASSYFRNLGDITTQLPQGSAAPNASLVSVSTGFFDAVARVRIDQLDYAERALIQRSGTYTQVIRIQRVPPWVAAAPANAGGG